MTPNIKSLRQNFLSSRFIKLRLRGSELQSTKTKEKDFISTLRLRLTVNHSVSKLSKQSRDFFCPTKNPKDVSFTVINDEGKQQILSFKKLEPTQVLWYFFAWKVTEKINRLSKQLPINFLGLTNRLIDYSLPLYILILLSWDVGNFPKASFSLVNSC